MRSIETVMRHLARQCKNVPGILRIDKIDSAILVFVDTKKLKIDLPNEMYGFPISQYDVRKVLLSANAFVQMVKDEGIELVSDEHKLTYECFIRTIELCRTML